ncbi:hypothetical protein OIDMADRAFT_181261 [Oidiodendron maius Zn]|uniref:Uncharacterized protein n=1 Tax=Oidiodendron maius (strain Zn) TaxID=913774 RepID=A0A0C3DDH7_OIDMZ|nr:hypothetical protein OIDMADRAFT_181261 [Oidiodendron maius Zn]
MLPHRAKVMGNEPCTPAPVKSMQGSFLQNTLRRLSSSTTPRGHSFVASKASHHGVCERIVLNVNYHRERCQISELNQSKLQRVAFCVDVEIASGLKSYDDSGFSEPEKVTKEKKQLSVKGEGAALEHSVAFKKEKRETDVKNSGITLPLGLGKCMTETNDALTTSEKDTTKKEKKKRSDGEKKAWKEKKRKQAEENGVVPVEVVSDVSGGSNTRSRTLKTQASRTTDTVRIYRRCCQLRETPILKKITEQLRNSASEDGPLGVVNKLDLTGHWLYLPDVITLADFLAIIPVKDLVLENCGLTDEGTRAILAGLLTAKSIYYPGRRPGHREKDGEAVRGRFIERLVLKNNKKIGQDGWQHICLFINMCRSLKSLDMSNVPFPHTTSASNGSMEMSQLLAKAVGERLAGNKFEFFALADCGITTDQLGDLTDGFIKSGLRRLDLAGNNITSAGMKHIARYIREGQCDGLDLGRNDLRD